MVIRKIHPLKWWVSLAVILMFLSIALPAGFSIWYTTIQLKHECTALNLILSNPVPKPSDPKANPSRERSYEFYVAIKQWAQQDHC